MRPFNAAWAVLKEDIHLTPETRDYIGEGSFRSTYANPANQGEVVKVGDKQGFNMANIAASNALAQLGYPVAPETPVMIDWQSPPIHTPFRKIAVTQPRANETASQKLSRLYTEHQGIPGPHAPIDNFRRDFENMSYDMERGDPLVTAIGVNDVRKPNIGMFDDEMKTIDFETRLADYKEPRYDGSGSRLSFPNIENWLKVPDEQRRAFINLYGDREIFEPWTEARGGPFGLDAGEPNYRRSVRNLEFMNDVIDNPEQRRLFEYIDEDWVGDEAKQFGQKAGMDRWRTLVAMRDKERRDRERWKKRWDEM